MPRKNRAYKKGAPHRDARLFVIVAEGEREDAYFSWFHRKNPRVKIQIVPREENRSAPNHFLTRVEKFLADEKWRPQDQDQLWFVLDVDRWSRKVIEELRTHCEIEPNWHLAISNPCFEVWILFHILEALPYSVEKCNALKKEVHRKFPNGFHPDDVCPLIGQASFSARNADNNPAGFFPGAMKTKVYLLAEELLALMGENWAGR